MFCFIPVQDHFGLFVFGIVAAHVRLEPYVLPLGITLVFPISTSTVDPNDTEFGPKILIWFSISFPKWKIIVQPLVHNFFIIMDT